MSDATLQSKPAEAVNFSPRRLGHANLFVGKLDRSMAFYNKVVGFEEVRREPGITAGFLTNGNTHHDIGMGEVREGGRIGIGGHVQIPDGRGVEPGLNHIGWEMENEAELVAAYRRALDAKVEIHRRADHQISHSIYLFDPDGNLNEFYADALKDWRTIFNPSRDDLITSEWDVESVGEGDTAPKYDPAPELRKVADAILHPVRITHMVMVARDYPAMVRFYSDVGGLTAQRIPGPVEATALRGRLGEVGLVIFPEAEGLPAGLHQMSFQLASEAEFAPALKRLADAGVKVEREIDNADKRSIFLRDPDGFLLEFAVRRRNGVGSFAGQPAHLAPFHV